MTHPRPARSPALPPLSPPELAYIRIRGRAHRHTRGGHEQVMLLGPSRRCSVGPSYVLGRPDDGKMGKPVMASYRRCTDGHSVVVSRVHPLVVQWVRTSICTQRLYVLVLAHAHPPTLPPPIAPSLSHTMPMLAPFPRPIPWPPQPMRAPVPSLASLGPDSRCLLPALEPHRPCLPTVPKPRRSPHHEFPSPGVPRP